MSALDRIKAAQVASKVKSSGGKYIPGIKGIGRQDVRFVPCDTPFLCVAKYFTPIGVLISPLTWNENTKRYEGSGDPLFAAANVYYGKSRADRDNAEHYKALGRKLQPTRQYLWPAVVVGEEDQGVRILTCTEALHKHLLALIAGDQELGIEGVGDVWNLDTGRTLRVIKSQENGKTFADFGKSFFLSPSKFASPEQRATFACPDLAAQPSTEAELAAGLRAILAEAGEAVPDRFVKDAPAAPANGDQAIDRSEFNRLLDSM